MPTLTNSHSEYYNLLRTMVPNPGQKLITQDDERRALNAAALFVASKLGGLWYVDDTMRTTPDVSDITVPNNIHKISYAEIIDTSVTPNTITFFDVVPYELFRRLNDPVATSDKFAFFWPEMHQLHIEPAPTVLDQTVRVLAWGMPNFIGVPSTTLYDGAVEQIYPIVHEAASLLRQGKSRDPQEAAALHQRALEGIEACLQMQAQRREVTRVGVARQYPPNRLRRI